MKLIITEKQTVADEISKVLNIPIENKGGYYESNQYLISWAAGHLFTLGYPENQNENWKGYGLEGLPMFAKLKIFPIAATKQQLNVLVSLIGRQDVTEIINAGDAGIEGEGIQWEIYDYAFKKNKRSIPVHRLWISSISMQAIQNGFNHLEPEGSRKLLYQAFLARRNGDWFYGMNTSRFFGTLYNVRGLSSGSVKNQILGMVVKRCQEIKNFKPEPYYQIEATFEYDQGENVKVYFDGIWNGEDGNKIENQIEAEDIASNIKNKNAFVNKYEDTEKNQKPPALYNLTKLQSDAIKKFGISSDRTLEILQSLYINYKIATYPRTDSEYITSDTVFLVPDLINVIAQSESVKRRDINISNMAAQIIKDGLQLEQIVNDKKVSDHPGIMINDNFKNFDVNKLGFEEWNILSLILKRMIIALAKKYSYRETVIQVVVENQKFKVSGRIPVDYGYIEIQRKLFGYTGLPEDEIKLPEVEVGQSLNVEKAVVKSKVTTPPAYYNESSLFLAMENIGSSIEDESLRNALKEKKGIGTSATRAEIFKELLDKGYLYKDDSKSKKTPLIKPTELGEKIYMILPKEMTSPELAAKWQVLINKIQNGEITYDYYILELESYLRKIMADYKKIDGIDIETALDKPTPKQINMMKNISATLNIPLPEQMTITTVSQYIKDNMDRYIACPNKKYGSMDDNKVGKCPLCGGVVYVSRDASRYYCSQYKAGCKFNVMKEDYSFKNLTGKNISKGVIKSLLEKNQVKVLGKTISVDWNTGVTKKGYITHTYTIKS